MKVSEVPGFGALREKSDSAILAEWHHWNNKIKNATRGSALSTAHEFREDVAREICRRRLEIPNGNTN